MEMRHRKWQRFGLQAMLSSKQLVFCALIIDLLSTPLLAQSLRYPLQDNAALKQPLAIPDDRDKPHSKPSAGARKTCSIQLFSGMVTSVSVTSLQIPPKAQREYERACVALQSKKLPEAEQHLRKATEIYPKYVAGWVMLGQTLAARQQTAEARDACSRASSADSNYLPAYLCLAEMAGREQEWNEVLNLTHRALELDASNDAYAYFFRAIAYFNLNQLSEAESSALKAEEIDREHYEPLLQLLLAQIYEAKKDLADAASHLRKYLRLAPSTQASDKLKMDEAQNPE
jgi:tetratricopeptide (TPR) repeat protein